jgi:hypothetical protein
MITCRNCCRVVQINESNDKSRVKDISMKPYRIFADQDLEASGKLVCLESTIIAEQDRPLLLFVYEKIWWARIRCKGRKSSDLHW